MELPFIKKFDVRGIFGEDIHPQDAFYLARAVACVIPLKKILLGWDTRPSSKILAQNVISALKGKDVQIDYIDLCPTEYITAASAEMDYDLCISFTGSHNTYAWTGMLMHVRGGESVRDELMEQIVQAYEKVSIDQYIADDVDLSLYHDALQDVESIYANRLVSLIPQERIQNMIVNVDVGDGSGFRLLDMCERLYPQIQIRRLCDRRLYDRNSHHIADPSKEENVEDLKKLVVHDRCDAGFAMDSDADRVLCVDALGQYINGSTIGGLFAQVLLGLLHRQHMKFGYAVECGPSMYNTCMEIPDFTKNNSIIPIPVGRSIIRGLIRSHDIDVGVENVGHFYTKEFFMTDSSLFAMLIVLCWMSEGHMLAEVHQLYPDGQRGEQDKVQLGSFIDTHIDMLYDELHKKFHMMRKITIDGVRGEIFRDIVMVGWFCLRYSGYEHKAKDYYGAIDPEIFSAIEEVIKKYGATN